eukprot:7642410-Pyramimonas_sp.AAC.1
MEHGKVTVRWQGRRITIPVESLRRAVVYMAVLFAGCCDRLQHDSLLNAWKCVVNVTNAIRKKALTIGWVRTGAGCQLTAEAIKHNLVFHVILDVASILIKVSNCWAGVCAHCISRLPSLSEGANSSLLVRWSQDGEDDYSCIILEGNQSISME